jgi:type II secretory pathway pseudopilin PulG
MPGYIALLIAVVGLVILFIWNGINFSFLKKHSSDKNKNLDDAKYWELKSKYEFMLAVVALITAMATFLGINTLDSIKKEVKHDFQEKVDSVSKSFTDSTIKVNKKLQATNDSAALLNKKVSNYLQQLSNNTHYLTALEADQIRLKVFDLKSNNDLQDLSRKIDSINHSNKIKSEFYLVNNVPFVNKRPDYPLDLTIYFKDLKTSSGDKLPSFKNPPVIISANLNNAFVQIGFTYKDHFDITVSVTDTSIKANNVLYGKFIIYPVE